jgi:hypothetical protein
MTVYNVGQRPRRQRDNVTIYNYDGDGGLSSVPVAANNGTNCTPGSADCSNVPTQRQLEGIKEQQCGQQAEAAFGPFVTQESLTSTLFGGVMGWILGKSIPAIGQGLAVSQVARFHAKALNYNATLQGCDRPAG